jgi:electron transfer flavoprotein beta subunit
MKITACIKRVPDTEARLKIAPGGAVDATGVKFIISPYDEYALEAGFRIRDAQGSGEVIAMSVGEAPAAEQLRSALAMGADRALLLKGQTSIDGLATAKALAAEIAGAGADLVLLGMKAVDDDQQQVGPMLAELMGVACITAASDIVIEDGKVVCHREIEGGIEVVEASLPAVVTLTKGEHEPRYPSLKGIMAAKKKPLEEKEAQIPASRITMKDLTPPSERPAGRVVGQGKDAVPELVRLLRDEAKVL